MKFLFVCGREVDYTRNQVLLRALNRLGDVETIAESGAVKSLLLRSVRVALRAIPSVLSERNDLIFVGFYGHLLMLPIGIFSRRPILFDAFVSTFDTLTADRQKYSPASLMGKLAAWLDRTACGLADKILLDTRAQEQYFSSFLGVSSDKLSSLPVSCNEDIFFPREIAPKGDHRTQVLSYSTYLPIHGIHTIISAAELLRKEPIEFKLIGQGPLYESIHHLADELDLHNVTFSPPVSLQRLSDEIATADICLGGHFGLSAKANRVIPGKIYQMLAMARPVIAADSLANKTLLQHGISAYLCPAGNPAALAEAILHLHGDPELCHKISLGGHEIYERIGSESYVTEGLRKLIAQMMNNN